jgi:hypothetical protein
MQLSEYTAEILSFIGRVEQVIRLNEEMCGETPAAIVIHPATLAFIREESGEDEPLEAILGVPFLRSFYFGFKRLKIGDFVVMDRETADEWPKVDANKIVYPEFD